jgi:hypothetical protein
MQIAYYYLWLKGVSLGKGLDQASLKLKTIVYIGDTKLLTKAMRSYPRKMISIQRIVHCRGLMCLDQSREI